MSKTAMDVIAGYVFERACGDYNATFELWDDDADKIIAELNAAGFVIVPKEPTSAMVRAVDESELVANEFRLNPAVAIEAWRIMIAVASQDK